MTTDDGARPTGAGSTGPTGGATRTVEVELKYDVDEAMPLPDWSRMPVASVGEAEPRELDAMYLDTAELGLAYAGYALRRRTGGPDEGWHLKGPRDEGGGRVELQWPLGPEDEIPEGVVEAISGIVGDADPAVDESAHDGTDAVTRAQEQRRLRGRVDVQEGDGQADAKGIPAESSADPRPFAVGGDLVVLRGAELLGVQAEHRQQSGEADGDEHPKGLDELLHARRLGLVHPEHRQECLLRDLDRTHPLHPLLAFLLFLEQLPLAGDVPTVTLGEDVLAHRADGLAGDDVAADGRLDRDLEHLARDELLQSFGQLAAGGMRTIAVDDDRQGVDRLAVDEDVDLGEVRLAVAELLVIHRGVTLTAALQLVEIVDDELGERAAVHLFAPGRRSVALLYAGRGVCTAVSRPRGGERP